MRHIFHPNLSIKTFFSLASKLSQTISYLRDPLSEIGQGMYNMVCIEKGRIYRRVIDVVKITGKIWGRLAYTKGTIGKRLTLRWTKGKNSLYL